MDTTPEQVTARVEAELAAFCADARNDTRSDRMLIEEFTRLRARPRPITVNFSGGITQTCYMVTRSNGAYCVVYLPTAGLFSLCVDSMFGPVDIGVHGPALACFASV